ncbi:type I restriction endonuclease subunit R [Fusobacterium varium]
MMNIKEKQYEQDIEHYMLDENGYIKGNQETYDKEKAIDLPKLITFIKATQPKQWQRYERNYGADSENKLYKRFQESVNNHGLVYVLRHGIEDRGAKIKFVAFKAETDLNQKIIDDYNANILECTRQFKYSIDNENSIDMVIFINGIPIVAIELKNQFTGQDINNAKRQFMEDRDPRELCFNFDSRFLVYFGVDLNEIVMTTELKKEKTFFLPFNQGSNGAGNVGGKGNPATENGYATDYLWKNILRKDVLLEILQRYIHISKETKFDPVTEKKKTIKKLIFPRYHQLDVVTRLIKNVKSNGAGHNYLIQHSAGSGKSNSIAWLAYGLANLHNKDNEKIFNSVIVVTDRTVLDSQLQDTIYSFDHTKGVVEKIDGTSKDLRDAINNGKKIIITTLQKFPYIYQEVDDNTNKRFAIIVDEAHSSQTGNSARKLKEALADTEEALKEFAELEGEEEENLKDGEDFILQEMLAQGQQKNLSFFAFTATPKQKTLEMFGDLQENRTFKPFHIYSMKQAIEEGFILDVLKNYTTYRTCYKIAKAIEENPELPTSKALKAIQKYESLHPHNLAQKTAIIVEMYREVTKNKIGGRAKAMVITASRLHAVRYYHEFKRYLERKGYNDIEILIAFSGAIKDGDIEYSEETMNKRKDGSTVKERQLPEEFHKDEYSMLIVAEKYQTGFDEPLLHTMFVDKKLKGVKAVQTLSRLNRTCSGKTDTYVLDFVNEAEDIQKSFAPYFECTILDEGIDPNRIYDIRKNIQDFNLYSKEDIDDFLKLLYKKGKQTSVDLGKLFNMFKPITDKYLDLDEKQRYEYKGLIKTFNKWYSYICQITRMYDREIQEEFNFTYYLEKLLPEVRDNRQVDLTNKLKLEFYKLEKVFDGSITLNPTDDDSTIKNPKTVKPQEKKDEEEEVLDIIIKKINDRFKEKFDENDKVIVETIFEKCKKDEQMRSYAQNNDEEVFSQSIFPEMFKKMAQECYMQSMNSFSKLFANKDFYESIMEEIAREAFKEFNQRN